jgi:3-phosphoshikimate 1-carboxyvinyltransferase
LAGTRADVGDLPDCAQTLAVVAAFARGTTRLDGVSTLRRKETDRVAALVAEMAKLGARVRAVGNDSIEVTPGDAGAGSRTIETYDDHRMAMSFALAGLKVSGIRISHPEVVSKSFPNFWEYWDRLYPAR